MRRRILGSSQRPDRDWDAIINAYERGVGEVQSLDDLVVLEAVIILSKEEQARTENVGKLEQLRQPQIHSSRKVQSNGIGESTTSHTL